MLRRCIDWQDGMLLSAGDFRSADKLIGEHLRSLVRMLAGDRMGIAAMDLKLDASCSVAELSHLHAIGPQGMLWDGLASGSLYAPLPKAEHNSKQSSKQSSKQCQSVPLWLATQPFEQAHADKALAPQPATSPNIQAARDVLCWQTPPSTCIDAICLAHLEWDSLGTPKFSTTRLGMFGKPQASSALMSQLDAAIDHVHRLMMGICSTRTSWMDGLPALLIRLESRLRTIKTDAHQWIADAWPWVCELLEEVAILYPHTMPQTKNAQTLQNLRAAYAKAEDRVHHFCDLIEIAATLRSPKQKAQSVCSRNAFAPQSDGIWYGKASLPSKTDPMPIVVIRWRSALRPHEDDHLIASQIKLAPKDEISSILKNALRGIPLKPLQSSPDWIELDVWEQAFQVCWPKPPSPQNMCLELGIYLPSRWQSSIQEISWHVQTQNSIQTGPL